MSATVIPDQVPAVHLTEDADWEAIAEWCGGDLSNRPVADSGEYETYLTLTGGPSAGEGDWIVKTPDGFIAARDVAEELAWQQASVEAIRADEREYAPPLSARLLGIIRDVDAHIDANTAPVYREQPLAGHWARVTKVCEEAGEVWQALSKCTGENPRKGVCGSWDDLLGELGDTVSAAACAIQHITKDEAVTAGVIMAAFEKAHARIPAATTGETA